MPIQKKILEAIEDMRDAINAAIDYHTLPGGVFTYRYGDNFNLVQELQDSLEDFDDAITEEEEESVPGCLGPEITQLLSAFDHLFPIFSLPPVGLGSSAFALPPSSLFNK